MYLAKRLMYRAWNMHRAAIFRKKLRRLAALTRPAKLNAADREEHLKLWSVFKTKTSPIYPALYAAINGISTPLYTPEIIYYLDIEPVLNNRAFTPAYADKNFYEKHLPGYSHLFPVTVARGMNGIVLDRDYRHIEKPEAIADLLEPGKMYLLKPGYESSGGRDIMLIDDSIPKASLSEILANRYHLSFLLQEKITQHEWFASFNTSSVNTVRILTYRSPSGNSVHPLHAVLRFGKPGSLVDNQAAGGLTVGINREGLLNSFAVDKSGKIYDTLEQLKPHVGEQVPMLNDIKELAIAIASEYSYHRILGFDFCVDSSNKVILLEINCKNIEINFIQMNNGPLFGEFTTEVIEFCKHNKRSVVFDFHI